MVHVIMTSLIAATCIPHAEGSDPSKRYKYHLRIKKAYIDRKDDMEDSLASIRQNNYLDPDTVVAVKLPGNYDLDTTVRKRYEKLLRNKGLDTKTLGEVNEAIVSLRASLKQLHDDEKSRILDDSPVYLHLREELEIEHGKSPDYVERRRALEKRYMESIDYRKRCKALENEYLDIPGFPYVSMARTDATSPPVRVTKTKTTTYYALSTSLPITYEEIMVKSYVDAYVQYMLNTMITKCDAFIDEFTLITYDYYIGPNASFYLFIGLE